MDRTGLSGSAHRSATVSPDASDGSALPQARRARAANAAGRDDFAKIDSSPQSRPSEVERLASHFQRVPLVLKETLESRRPDRIFLLSALDGVIPMVASTEDGSSVEVGIVGKEAEPMFRSNWVTTFQIITGLSNFQAQP
jgi:hypothetical protein